MRYSNKQTIQLKAFDSTFKPKPFNLERDKRIQKDREIARSERLLTNLQSVNVRFAKHLAK